MEKIKVYFASPFFNSEQVEREERLKSKLRTLGFEVFSPKEAYFCKPEEPEEKRKEVFDGNCKAIRECDVLFAVTDGKDMGTIWEAGYANGLNNSLDKERKIQIVYYCETLPVGGCFNLMLALSADIICLDDSRLDWLYKFVLREKVGRSFTDSYGPEQEVGKRPLTLKEGKVMAGYAGKIE